METETLPPQLSDIIREFDSATQRVANLERTYTEDRWQRKPGPDQWSAIECIQHLNLSNEQMLPRIRESMRLLSKSAHQNKYHLDLIGWLLVKVLSSKSPFSKSKTSAPFLPVKGLNVQDVLKQFRSLQQDIIRAIHDSDGLPLDAGKVESAFNSRVKYNIYSAFRALAVHEHRHLDQAERTV